MPRKAKNARSDSTPGPKPRGRVAVQPGKVRPPRLSTEARRLWRRLAPELEDANVLTPRDAVTLAIACEVGAFAQQAAATLHSEGLTTLDAAHANTERRSPTWVVFTQAAAQWLAYAGALGLSPRAREALTVKEASPGDEYEAYLRQGVAMRARQQEAPKEAEEW